MISGVRADPTPLGSTIIVVRVESAGEMHEATAAAFAEAAALVMAAAVSDYRFDATHDHKVKKTKDKITATLIPTVDIISELAVNKGDRLIIGFAAETDNIVKNAKDKLLKKKVDLVVANVIGRAGVGFGSEKAEAAIISTDGVEDLGEISKANLAEKVLDELERLLGKA